MALVEMIDELLTILHEQPEYRAFHLDSQSVVLEDYLEIRPQKRTRLEGYIKEGRILVGPWYILPDEYFVGGENLIRNLLLGHRVSKAHGGVSKIGYSPFSWGQISQLPQLYAGFGIDLIMFYRGVNSLESPKAEFVWEGADGTKSLSSRFSTMPRYNFYFGIYRPVVQGYTAGDVKYDANTGGQLLHPADPELGQEDYHRIASSSQYDPDKIKASVESLTQNQDGDFTSGQVIWMEGHDSSGPSSETSQLIKDLQIKFPDMDIKHATLEEYRDILRETLNMDELPLVKGERRSAQYDHRSGNLYGYTTSARMFLKQMNFDVERWLQTYAEPMDVLAGIMGMDNDDQYLNIAWKKLIQNSAHDSIGGCSLDAVHEDGVQRYKESREIAQGVFRRGLEFIAHQIGGLELDRAESALIIYNPLPYPRAGVQKFILDLPSDILKKTLMITDVNGNPCHYEKLTEAVKQPVLEQLTDRPLHLEVQRYEIFLDVPEIPGMGYSTFKLALNDSEYHADSQGVTSQLEEDGRPVLDNGLIRAEWNDNGTFTLTNLQTEKVFPGIGEMCGEPEAGNAWVHTPESPFSSSVNGTAAFKILNQGPLMSSVEVTLSYNLDDDPHHPKQDTIHVVYSMFKDNPVLDVKIDLFNNFPNRRLRYALPTSLNAEYSWGEGQFDVLARPAHRPDTSDWVEQPMYDYPMHHFVDVSNEAQGLAVLVDGLKEYELTEGDDQKLHITLFRAFTHVVVPSSVEDYSHEQGSQCLGVQSYHLGIMPHSGDWQMGGVSQAAQSFNYPFKAMQSSTLNGKLAPRAAFFELDSPDLVLSALKTPEHHKPGVVIRVFNPTNSLINTTLSTCFKIQEAFITDLEEMNDIPKASTNAHQLEIIVEPKKIITLRLIVNYE